MPDNLPLLAVLIVTYNRRDILRGTLDCLRENLDYPHVRYYVADDGSDDGTQDMARDKGALVVQSNRVGMGANANAGLRCIFTTTPFVLQLQDDMHARMTIPARLHVEWLAKHSQDGYIRLWGIGGHHLNASLDERYWRVDWKSPDLYIASDRPHIKHKRFHDVYGYYPEGLHTAETEEAWCHQTKTVAGRGNIVPCHVLVPQMETEANFEHMGWHCRWRSVGL